MSKKLTFEMVLKAANQGASATFTKVTKSVRTFNKEVGNGDRAMGALNGTVRTMIGTLVGLQVAGGVGNILLNLDKSAFALEASLRAANREFDNIGSVDKWEKKIESLSQKLRVYSKADIRNATVRTVDMTKRLGLSADQMERTIELTAHLSAGRTDLVGGIERVTAALRGEAEASEFLSLTLNEDYVKGWYNVRGAIQGAWKDLTDIQKAQVRYQVFLEQAIPVEGRAAESANTLSGALGEIRKNIHDALEDNKELVDSLGLLAVILNENAGNMGHIAAQIATVAGKTIEWAVQNKELVKTLGKGAGLLMVLNLVKSVVVSLVTVISGLRKAFFALTSMKFIAWMGTVRAAMIATTATTLTFSLALGAAAGATLALLAGYKAGEWLVMHKHIKGIADATAELQRNQTKVARRFREISKETGVTVTSMEELDQAVKDGKIHFDEATTAWKNGSKEMSGAVSKSTSIQKKVTEKALDDMKKAYKKYGDDIKKIQEDIISRQRSLAEELRAMSRTGMSDLGAWRDRKKEAEQYYQAAKKAAEAGNFEDAVAQADKAKNAYKDLNREVKDGDKVLVTQQEALKNAISGVEKSGKLAISILEKQKKATEDSAETLKTKMDEAIKSYAKGAEKLEDDWKTAWVNMGKDAAKQIDAIEKNLNDLTARKHQVIVEIKEVVKKRWGGVVGKFASGTLLGGYGGGDKIRALLEAGELVVRKESVRAAGRTASLAFNAGRFDVVVSELLKRMNFDVGDIARMRLGGIAGNALNTLQLPKFQNGGMAMAGMGGQQTINVNLTLPGSNTPVRVVTDKENASRLLRQVNIMKKRKS